MITFKVGDKVKFNFNNPSAVLVAGYDGISSEQEFEVLAIGQAPPGHGQSVTLNVNGTKEEFLSTLFIPA